MGEHEHWHYSTYRVTNDPPEVLAMLCSETFPDIGAAKEGVRRLAHDIAHDPGLLSPVGFPAHQVLAVVSAWLEDTDAEHIYYWPYTHAVFPCTGTCSEAAYRNAVAMADYLTNHKIIPARVVGTPERFGFQCAPSDWGTVKMPPKADYEAWIRQGPPGR